MDGMFDGVFDGVFDCVSVGAEDGSLESHSGYTTSTEYLDIGRLRNS